MSTSGGCGRRSMTPSRRNSSTPSGASAKCSKTGAEPGRAWSLSARLTAWYAGSAFALVAAVTGFLYWALARGLDREDAQLLADKVRVLLAVLGHEENPAAQRQEVEESQQAFQHSPVFVRIIRFDGTVSNETTGMAEA